MGAPEVIAKSDAPARTVCRGIPSRFLAGLQPRELDAILAAATPRSFLANSVVVNQGDPAAGLYLLVRGRARFFLMTQEGHKILLLWLTPGEIFGGQAGLSKAGSYIVSTETLQDSDTLFWDHTTLRSLVPRYPKLLDNLLSTTSDYLSWYLVDHVALTPHNAPQRLAYLILTLASVIGHDTPDGIELDATNEELASAANITPFTTSRLLNDWRRKRALEKRRGKILLRSRERLFHSAGLPFHLASSLRNR